MELHKRKTSYSGLFRQVAVQRSDRKRQVVLYVVQNRNTNGKNRSYLWDSSALQDVDKHLNDDTRPHHYVQWNLSFTTTLWFL